MKKITSEEAYIKILHEAKLESVRKDTLDNIDDLRNRIDNLSNVQTALLELIPFEDRS